MTAALAGVMMAGRMNAAEPREGSGYELDAIASVAIGGTSCPVARVVLLYCCRSNCSRSHSEYS